MICYCTDAEMRKPFQDTPDVIHVRNNFREVRDVQATGLKGMVMLKDFRVLTRRKIAFYASKE